MRCLRALLGILRLLRDPLSAHLLHTLPRALVSCERQRRGHCAGTVAGEDAGDGGWLVGVGLFDVYCLKSGARRVWHQLASRSAAGLNFAGRW